MTAEARRILRIEFTATDLARSQDFYAALGFEALGTDPVGEADLVLLGVAGSRARRLRMRLGLQEVGFLQFDPPGRDYPDDSTSTDLWFQHIAIAVSDMEDAHRRAIAAGARPITRGGPQTLPANTGGVTAFKFRDPDGHPLEFLLFPPGRGLAEWHRKGRASPCLGIDHTAMAVGDAAATQAFYAGLGLSAGRISHNGGTEQDRLDDVADVKVAVVPMMLPQRPPHVELLGYAVGSRRPMPPDTRADDVWCTRVWIATEDVRPARLSHDPDRHAIVLAGASSTPEPVARSRT